MDANKYKETAHLYDLDPRGIVQDDIPFYLDFARHYGDAILEVACGTGRVSLAIARAGYDVTGFDLSKDMIKVLEDKLKKEDADIRERVQVFVADMTEYSSDVKYSLIIIPFRAFQLLTEEQQTRRFLELVRSQLSDDGVFIINTYKPYGTLDESWVKEETEDWIIDDKQTGNRVRRTNIRSKIDLQKQLTYLDLNYNVEEPDGITHRLVEKITMKYYYEEQLRELLLSSGFVIKEQYGYYDCRSIDKGPELIFVCKGKKTFQEEK